MDAAMPSGVAEPGDVVPSRLADILAALGTDDPQPVGRFRVELTTDAWWWSDEVYEMHGFAPGEVVPTTALLLAHKHPDDRDRAADALARTARTGKAFGSMHRIVDANGQTRTLAVAARGRRPGPGSPVAELAGYFVDVTDAHHEAARREATAAIRAADASRSDIEQAKGVVMLAYGVGPDEAFEVLRRRSNHANVPVRELARRLVGGLRTSGDVVAEARSRVDGLLDAAVDESAGRPSA
jgi:hypothetical protein